MPPLPPPTPLVLVYTGNNHGAFIFYLILELSFPNSLVEWSVPDEAPLETVRAALTTDEAALDKNIQPQRVEYMSNLVSAYRTTVCDLQVTQMGLERSRPHPLYRNVL